MLISELLLEMPAHKNYTKEQQQEMAELYRSGMIYRQIGKQFGCDNTTVIYHIQQLYPPDTPEYEQLVADNLQNRSSLSGVSKNYTKEQRHQMAELYRSGMSYKQIGKRFQTTDKSVMRNIKNILTTEQFKELEQQNRAAVAAAREKKRLRNQPVSKNRGAQPYAGDTSRAGGPTGGAVSIGLPGRRRGWRA